MVQGPSSGEGLIWAVRDPITQRQPIKEKGRVTDYEDVLVDPGVEGRSGCWSLRADRATALRVLGREGNILFRPSFAMPWDTGDPRTLTKNSPAKATGAHISIIGHVTRDELLRTWAPPRLLTASPTGSCGFESADPRCCPMAGLKRSRF